MNVRQMIRGSASVVSITDVSMRNLDGVDLTVFYNMKDLYININKTGVCAWIEEKRTQYPQINIARHKNKCVPGVIMRDHNTAGDSVHPAPVDPGDTSGKPVHYYADEDEKMDVGAMVETSAGEIVGYIVMLFTIGGVMFALVVVIRCV